MSKNRTKKIAFFCRFNQHGYSGGRLHAMFLIEALAYNGWQVDVFCNQLPGFLSEFVDYPGHQKICWKTEAPNVASPKTEKYEYVVVVPHRAGDFLFYLNAAKYVLASSATGVLLNFESSSWFNEVSPVKRPVEEWGNWVKFSKYCDVILSSTIISKEYASKDYNTVFNKPDNIHCYPSVNSIVADKSVVADKEERILFMGRWADAHKNSDEILKIFCKELEGYEVAIVVGSGVAPDGFLRKLEQKSKEVNMSFTVHSHINELQKFSLLRSSKVFVYTSGFEGFGLPPVEALYCGIPCVCFDLPVLREVNGDSLSYVPMGDYEELRKEVVRTVQSNNISRKIKKNKKAINDIAKFESFAERLERIFCENKKEKRSFIKETLRKIFCFYEDMQLLASNIIQRQQSARIDLNPSLLNSFVLVKWKLLIAESQQNAIGVFGSLEYLSWLETITSEIRGVRFVPIVENLPNNDTSLWGSEVVALQDPEVKDLKCIILATECFQVELAKKCREVLGSRVALIDMFKELPKGPYPKKI